MDVETKPRIKLEPPEEVKPRIKPEPREEIKREETKPRVKPEPPQEETHIAYCTKCRSSKAIRNPYVSVAKNGRKMRQGNCIECNNKVCRFIRDPEIKKSSP